jgi:hypothetical protein
MAASAFGVASKRPWAPTPVAGGDRAPGGGARALAGQELSNLIQDLWLDGDAVWLGTTEGLGVTRDRGESWTVYHAGNGLPTDDVVAAAAADGDIWASCIAVEEDEYGNDVYYGRGVAHYDAAFGRWFVYGKNEGLPADGPWELAWDIFVDDAGVVWVALWNGGIGKSEDDGATWDIIVPRDRTGAEITHFYSLDKVGDTIWAAAEVYYNPLDPMLPAAMPGDYEAGAVASEDGGATWTYYGRAQGLDGFFVVADIQETATGYTVWLGTAPPDPAVGEGKGVYMSEDGGASWTNYRVDQGLGADTVYAFTSAGAWAWAGTANGVSRTDDGGASWRTSSVEQGLPDYFVSCMGAASESDVWAGTYEGLGYSVDGGATWRRIDLSPRASPLDLPRAFAFPSPFAPERDGELTIRYALAGTAAVTIDIYDFAGRRVKRLVDHQARGPGDRIDDAWNGYRDDGERAANGVYFFTIDVDGKAAARGKFVLLE